MTNYEENEPVSVNRTYKARMFEMIFSDKKELLELYNAMNGTHYEDPELLVINTLKNAIYMSMQNDISFIIDMRLYLYEHQSTMNPNLPLRDLMYISDIYSNYTKDKNLYGTLLVEIPTPVFVIFYNGQEEQPDRQELKLSDMFSVHMEDPKLELKATMININRGHNQKLLDTCKTLGDYAEYTARVREYAKTMPLEAAVEQAITECIQENILAEFLKKNRAEAKSVSIYEYNEEKHMRQTREEGYDQGFTEGHANGFTEGHESGFTEGHESGFTEGHESGFTEGHESGFLEGLETGMKVLIHTYREMHLTEEDCCKKIIEMYQMPQEQAKEYIRKYWK